ncbi:MAG: DNA recombination protein RmuC [Alphaproteobacteria bacterium]|nr:DNA recombination protein RmuC [Alphaproteobacteria bacterium]
MSVTLILLTAILFINLILVIYLMVRLSRQPNLQSDLARIERGQKEDTGLLRQELNASLLRFNEAIRNSVEGQLDKVRSTVDEKLQTTLEKRIGESFNQVSERLEKVHQGLGEMHNLVLGVGDLKRVLTNVKTRGVWGEVQLGALLEQMLAPDQYIKNAKIKENTTEVVEYAVCLPDGLIPIDAKFPYEDYERLIAASEKADAVGVENAASELEKRIKIEAKRINEKYIEVPKTTDFAIMFLPTEGLYAEVMRRPGLSAEIQKKYKVTITGPSTLGAFLTSLQMGFRTLAIQKRSGEVWQALGEAKNEFNKYADWVEKVKKHIDAAGKAIDEAGTRTRAIERKLRDVSENIDSEDEKIALPN